MPYRQEGEVISFLNGTGAALVAGAPVVIGGYGIGVVLAAIGSAATDEGEVLISGVWDFIKPVTSGNTFAKGAPVYITVGSGTATAATSVAATGLYFAGFAAAAAAQGDTTVRCILAPFIAEGTRYLTTAVTATLSATDFTSKSLVVTVSTAGTATLNLPAVATIPVGAQLTMTKTGSAGAITIDAADSEEINGATTFAAADAQYDTVTLTNTGTAWFITDRNIA